MEVGTVGLPYAWRFGIVARFAGGVARAPLIEEDLGKRIEHLAGAHLVVSDPSLKRSCCLRRQERSRPVRTIW